MGQGFDRAEPEKNKRDAAEAGQDAHLNPWLSEDSADLGGRRSRESAAESSRLSAANTLPHWSILESELAGRGSNQPTGSNDSSRPGSGQDRTEKPASGSAADVLQAALGGGTMNADFRLPNLPISELPANQPENINERPDLNSAPPESPSRTFELRRLNHRAADHSVPDAMVRLPENFDPNKPVHLVIYNHGFGSTAKSSYDINKLDQQLAEAPPNTVLIIPEWQANPGSRSGSQGRLQEAGMFAGMLQEVLDKTPGLQGKTLKDIDSISIFAHSAGYGPTETEINNSNGLSGKVKSITLLDALYDGTGFDSWLQANIKDISQGNKQFNNFFFGTGDSSKSQAQRVRAMLSRAGLPASSMIEDYNHGKELMPAEQIAAHPIVFKYSSATDSSVDGAHLAMPLLYVGAVERAEKLRQ